MRRQQQFHIPYINKIFSVLCTKMTFDHKIHFQQICAAHHFSGYFHFNISIKTKRQSPNIPTIWLNTRLSWYFNRNLFYTLCRFATIITLHILSTSNHNWLLVVGYTHCYVHPPAFSIQTIRFNGFAIFPLRFARLTFFLHFGGKFWNEKINPLKQSIPFRQPLIFFASLPFSFILYFVDYTHYSY